MKKKPRKWNIGSWVKKHNDFSRRKLERTYVREVVESIESICRNTNTPFWHRRVHSSIYGAGLPDLVLIVSGRTFWLEFKRPKGSITPRQKATLNSIREAGGKAYAVVATSRREIEIQEPPDFTVKMKIIKNNGSWEGVRELLELPPAINIGWDD